MMDVIARPDGHVAFIERAEVIDGGAAVAIVLREHDGTTSAIRIRAEQLAD